MIALHERGLIDQLSAFRTHVDPMIPLEVFMDINPLSKIPTLELEDGAVLFDSHVICRWVDLYGTLGLSLFPTDLSAARRNKHHGAVLSRMACARTASGPLLAEVAACSSSANATAASS